MQSTISQGNDGLFILDLEDDPAESGYDAIDPGLYYVDADSGVVYTREAIDGDADDDGSWTSQGKLLPFVGDQQAPPSPTGLTVTAVDVVEDADGSVLTGFQVQWTTASSVDDVIGYTLEIDAQTYDASENGGAGGYVAATFATPIVRNFGVFDNPPTEGPYLVRGEFIGGVPYDFRLATKDAEGYISDWSSTVTETALEDAIAPEVPTNPSATPGFKLVGLRWDKNEEADLWFYQVRYYATSEGVDEAELVRTPSNLIIIKDLTPDIEYTFEVRAVDRSGGVATDENDLTAIRYDEDDTVGWSEAVTATPTKIGAADVSFNSVLTNILASNEIDADTIATGTLTVGGTNNADGITLQDEFGNDLLTMNGDGVLVLDPNDSSRAVFLDAGTIKFTDAYTGDVDTTSWTSALTADGLNATAVTFGSVAGGANAVPNAGFELASFVVPTSSEYTGTADWSGATSTVNMDVSTSHLTMTST